MVIFIFLIGVLAWYLYLFNGLVRYKQRVTHSWSNIDVQLKRRYDLIPKLVDIVREYSTHEKNLLEHITEIRTLALSLTDQNISEKSKVDKEMSDTATKLIAIAEKYPDLKANAQFLLLQEQLSETEDQIASSRTIYNQNVEMYNKTIQSFPQSIIASLHGFHEFAFFQ